MNISYNWLKDYIDIDLSPERVAEVLTSIGLETGGVEEVESIRGGLKGVVIGRVLTCTDHPDSDHLHVTTVDLGDGKATQIVCGAPNVAAGQTVVVATVGTTLYGEGDRTFQIKKSKIRGVESFGMICAEDEIGVGASHDGIIVLDPASAPAPGTPAAEYYGLTSDYVLEVDLTPNRIDAASHYGVARDLGAWQAIHLYGGDVSRVSLRMPEAAAASAIGPEGGIGVTVEDREGCLRYCGLTIRGVRVGESPQWLRDRLTAVGQRPINNIVDITNYILLGLGQPLHCFDIAHLRGSEIRVRTCAPDTEFVTLDGVSRKLDSSDLMICDAEGPVCIAGVFGGLDSGVTEAATDIFLESACFHPTRVRKTARRHGLSTDASFRFERGVDPNLAPVALRIAAAMVVALAGGRICGPEVDILTAEVSDYPVRFSYDRAEKLIGKEIGHEMIDNILAALDIRIAGRNATPGGEELDLLVPTYRYDVRRECDVVEEILRIYGYNNVEMTDTLHASLSYKTLTDTACDLQNMISEQLTAQGFNEILNNSLTAEGYYADNGEWPADTCVRLLNPLSNELSVMRRTLLYGGLESVAHNINRRENDLLFYEFGNVYRLDPDKLPTAESPLAPYSESSRLGIWMTGQIRQPSWIESGRDVTFYDLRAVVDGVLARLGLSQAELRFDVMASGEIFSASLGVATRSGRQLGRLGILAPQTLKKFDIRQPVMYADFDFAALVRTVAGRGVTFRPLPKTHPVRRDLALLIDKSVAMAEVEQVIRESERKMLGEVTLFDVYDDPAHLPEGKKSYAVTFTLQDPERTLQDKQIEAVMNKIVTNLGKRLGATLR